MRRVLAAILLLSSALPAHAADTAAELARVRARRAELQQRLDQAAAELAALETRLAEVDARTEALAAEEAGLEAELDAAAQRIATRVRTLYKRAHHVDPVAALLTGSSPSDAVDRATTVRHLVVGDRASTEIAAAARRRLTAVVSQLEAERHQAEELRAAQAEVVGRLTQDLAEAQTLERRLAAQRRAELAAERARAAAAAAAAAAARRAEVRAAGGYACPVAKPHSFTDTWGAPRSGGRRHQGTDILAPRGAHVYAVVGGVVDIRRPGPLSGNWLILRGVDGTHYYYVHLQGFAVADGARVDAGTLIAYNGDTGNARGTPHVHFEQHPGGGAPINPYPLLVRLCR